MASFSSDDITKAFNTVMPDGADLAQALGVTMAWAGALGASGLPLQSLPGVVERFAATNVLLALQGQLERMKIANDADAVTKQVALEALVAQINAQQAVINKLGG